MSIAYIVHDEFLELHWWEKGISWKTMYTITISSRLRAAWVGE